jgi:mono/diheme cytochrome c family protein
MAAFPFLLSTAAAEAGPSDETLRAGAEVYTAVCAQCHQSGGIGVAGRYPPLADNPNVADATYIDTVIRNGRTGVVTVNGETFDAVMPAQRALSDDDIVNVIAYIQSGFAAPTGPLPEVDTGPVAGTELPLLSNYAIVVAFAIALGGAALVLGPRVIADNDRRQLTWVDASMKSAVIVVGLIVGTAIIPSKVLELETVQDLPRVAQDLIAVGIWFGALVGGLWALWYAHRERRI